MTINRKFCFLKIKTLRPAVAQAGPWCSSADAPSRPTPNFAHSASAPSFETPLIIKKIFQFKPPKIIQKQKKMMKTYPLSQRPQCGNLPSRASAVDPHWPPYSATAQFHPTKQKTCAKMLQKQAVGWFWNIFLYQTIALTSSFLRSSFSASTSIDLSSSAWRTCMFTTKNENMQNIRKEWYLSNKLFFDDVSIFQMLFDVSMKLTFILSSLWRWHSLSSFK